MCEVLINTGTLANYGHISIQALLLIDGITLLTDAGAELQNMLNTIHTHDHTSEGMFTVMTVNGKSSGSYAWRLKNTLLKVFTSYTIDNEYTP